MASDVNAVIEGILQVDPDAFVVVRDAHGGIAANLNLELLHPAASIIQGWGNGLNMAESLDTSYKGIFSSQVIMRAAITMMQFCRIQIQH